MIAALPFPSVAPYRINQVTAAPLAMTGLFLAQLGLALLIDRSARHPWRAGWWAGALLLVGSVVLFFTLASWGNSDTTKLSHDLALSISRVRGEPLWMLTAPLIILLPYRMSMVHGLVAGGYAAAALLLARHWRCPAWGGWWALLICCSPMLRGFIQNAHTRQALLSLLLLPLLLWAGRLARLSRWGIILSTLGAATVHTSFAGTALIAMLPRVIIAAGVEWTWPRRSHLYRLLWVPLFLPVLLISVISVPVMRLKLLRYIAVESYFNTYAIHASVAWLQWALAVGLVLGCLQARLDPRLLLLRCRITQLLLLFGLFYLGIQTSISALWLPQITSRLADAVALFLLILYLTWIHHYRVYWCILPALYVTLHYWLNGRLLPSGSFSCGFNDEFLCIPDRWPWQVRY